jgi:hypothetical protein
MTALSRLGTPAATSDTVLTVHYSPGKAEEPVKGVAGVPTAACALLHEQIKSDALRHRSTFRANCNRAILMFATEFARLPHISPPTTYRRRRSCGSTKSMS